MLAAERPSLERCYGVCRAIARTHSKSFYLSSLFLDEPRRRAVWAVYAFCRTADDLVDRPGPGEARLAALDAWETRLRDAYAASADEPILIALADAARRFAIPIEPALELLRGARMDVTVDRYETFAQLGDYCYLVASTVGKLVLPVLGATSRDAERYAVTLGRAMQMTNILRDVGEDARLGRIYLPLDELRRFGCSEASILEGIVDEPFVALMRYQVARVRALYHDAEPGIALLAPRSRYTVRLALALYRQILERIEANGYDAFARRAYVPLRAKLLTALATAAR
ncbi:MAG TPA: squalene/phytoene synthase family protein [Candidatus Elarobacter sp.]